MYRKILLALDTTASDESLLSHVGALARSIKAEVLLLHVADGFAARHYDELQLAESQEMRQDRDYLQARAEVLRAGGLAVTTHLAMGNPPTEILKTAQDQQCDLIAMTTHGHRLLADVVLGTTISAVRHRTHIPMLIVRAE